MTLRGLVLLAFTACSASTSSGPDSPTGDSSRPAGPASPASPASPDATPPAEPADEGASFASPKQVDTPPTKASPGGPPDPELAARIKERFGDRCRYERACGDLVGVDCDAAVDGPYYYVTRKDLKTVSTCGGACMGGKCTDCPPKAWTCPTY